jgi:hypothetical protein
LADSGAALVVVQQGRRLKPLSGLRKGFLFGLGFDTR